jgi:hypothetical protein
VELFFLVCCLSIRDVCLHFEFNAVKWKCSFLFNVHQFLISVSGGLSRAREPEGVGIYRDATGEGEHQRVAARPRQRLQGHRQQGIEPPTETKINHFS